VYYQYSFAVEGLMNCRADFVIVAFALFLLAVPSCGDGVVGSGSGGEDYGDVGVGAAGHTKLLGGIWHNDGNEDPLENCVGCHGDEIEGGVGPACTTCHDNDDHTKKRDGFYHKKGSSDSCNICHGPDNSGGLGPACAPCHAIHD